MLKRTDLSASMFGNPGRSGQRAYLYAVFAWCYTCAWVGALTAAWMYYDRWPLCAKIAASIGLILTTPAGSDFFLLFRRRRVAQ
jgi:hypothetical protein